MWFDQEPVFGHCADDGKWSHPSTDCGRDMVPVPLMEGRDAKWRSTVDSRSASLVGGSEKWQTAQSYIFGWGKTLSKCHAHARKQTSQEPEVGKKYACFLARKFTRRSE